MNRGFPLLLFTLLAFLVVLGALFSFHRQLLVVDRRALPIAFSGELRKLEPLAEGPSSVEAIDRGGMRALVKEPEGKLLLWEQGVGSSVLYNGAVGATALSGNGRTACFQVTTGSKDRADLHCWQDGFGVLLIVRDAFTGSWQMELSEDGSALFLAPSLENSLYFGPVDALSSQEGTPTKGVNTALLFRAKTDQDPTTEYWITHLGRELAGGSVKFDDRVVSLALQSGVAARYAVSMESTNFDLNRDGGADILTFFPGTVPPTWRAYFLNGADGPTTNKTNQLGHFMTWRLGGEDSVPVPGDYNGDGTIDFATFSPGFGLDRSGNEGNWRLYFSKAGKEGLPAPIYETREILWGHGDAVAVPADYDGDGAFDVAVYLPGAQEWYLLHSSGGFNESKGALQLPGFGTYQQFGESGDVPVPGDYDGDGQADVALWSAKKNIWKYRSLSDQKATEISFGREGDIPLPADYNGDGKTEPAVYRPKSKTWFVYYGKGHVEKVSWGHDKAQPFVADFDADGKADLAFFFSEGGLRWEILSSRFQKEAKELMPNAHNVITRLNWGSPFELPVQLWQRKHWMPGQ